MVLVARHNSSAAARPLETLRESHILAAMRVLAAADIHGVFPIYEWLIQSAEDYQADVLVLAGDLFACDWPDLQREQGRKIIQALQQLAIPCFYLMGNDDNVGLDHEDNQIKPLHARRLSCAGYHFVGYQYTPPFVGDLFVKPERQIERDLEKLEPLLDSRTVLVTHAPARGTLDRTLSGEHVGSTSLAALLHRCPVAAHIFGHIHESFGRQRNSFNVAAAGARRAMVFELPSLSSSVIRGE